jgi:hypothetical protein
MSLVGVKRYLSEYHFFVNLPFAGVGVNTVALNKESTTIAAGSIDGTFKVSDALTASCQCTLPGHM